MGVEDLTLEQIFADLEQALENANQPPPGAFSVYEYVETQRIGRNAARNRIGKLLELGIIREIGKWNQRMYYERVSDET